jgi:hypothetical protein
MQFYLYTLDTGVLNKFTYRTVRFIPGFGQYNCDKPFDSLFLYQPEFQKAIIKNQIQTRKTRDLHLRLYHRLSTVYLVFQSFERPCLSANPIASV